MRRTRTPLVFGVVCLWASVATAEKSNQVRPTPSPIGNPALGVGELVLSPSLIYANYRDSLESGIRNRPFYYDIKSAGAIVSAQYGVSDTILLDSTLEAYRKFGTITGPSPGDPTQLVEAHALGWATKLGVQANVRVFRRGDADTGHGEPGRGDFSAYVFAKALGDIFRQDQVEPLSETEFSEKALTYRAGAAVHLYAGGGLFFAPFAGVEGVAFSGERVDTIRGQQTRDDFGGADTPYPFFGGDILWAPAALGTDYSQAISLAAILALAGEDEAGFGGKLLTVHLGYTFAFGGAPAPVTNDVDADADAEVEIDEETDDSATADDGDADDGDADDGDADDGDADDGDPTDDGETETVEAGDGDASTLVDESDGADAGPDETSETDAEGSESSDTEPAGICRAFLEAVDRGSVEAIQAIATGAEGGIRIEVLDQIAERLANASCDEVLLEGEAAIVNILTSGDPQQILLLKVNGEWKLDFETYQRSYLGKKRRRGKGKGKGKRKRRRR